MHCRAPAPRRAPRQPAPRTSGRAARLPAPSSPSIAAGQRASGRPHAATLWQWCCLNWARGAQSALVGDSDHAADAHRPRGMGSVFGTNSRATRRAGELAAADPANRARLGRRRELGERRRPKRLPGRAAFGHVPETAITHGALGGREGIRCAVYRAAVRRAATRKITTLSSPAFVTLRLVTSVSPRPANPLFSLGCASGRPPPVDPAHPPR
jgi:hypothetical protein